MYINNNPNIENALVHFIVNPIPIDRPDKISHFE